MIVAPVEQCEECGRLVVADKWLAPHQPIDERCDLGDWCAIAELTKDDLGGQCEYRIKRVTRHDAKAPAVAFDDIRVHIEDLCFTDEIRCHLFEPCEAAESLVVGIDHWLRPLS